MYKLVGLRKNGTKVLREYDNEKVARFEFEVISWVATKLELFENDILVDSYEFKQPDEVIYLINGQSPFNTINKRVLNKEKVALIEFESEKARCNWVTLYKEINGEKTLMECFVKGA